MKNTIFLLSFVFICAASSAQKIPGSVKGNLKDDAETPLADATVSVMSSADSSLVSFSLTSNSGFFEIKNLNAASYYLIISFYGFETLKKGFDISTDKPIADLQTITMGRVYKTLGEVIVQEKAPIQIKGDTLAYNADFFKTKPNATVEDLLKKLPGVQVERDGTIKAQGEDVQKVYVDGKEFFGNDPKLATRNLNADMIDQVEVYDDMSEQSKFNRIDDGSRTKAINLKLKKDKKKGLFGKANVGYGTEDRYDAGLSANFFKGATQVSVIAKSNNTNNIGFSMSDMMGMFGTGGFGNFSGGGAGGFGGGGGMTVARGGGGGGAMNFGAMNIGSGVSGISKTASAGINYRDTWSAKFDANGSYFYNHADAGNLRNSFQQRFLTDSTLLTDQQTWSNNNNGNHRLNFNITYTLDSLNSIIYQPNISFQNSSSVSDDSTARFAQTNNNSYLLNDTRNLRQTAGDGFNWTNNLIWRRKLNKIGRTFSLNFSNTYSITDRDGFVTSTGSSYNNSGAKIRDNNFRQQNLQKNGINNYAVNLSYTEPLARNKIWEVNYGYIHNENESERDTYDFNPVTGKYELPNSFLSNHFNSQNKTNRIGTNFRFIEKKFNYQIGVSAQNVIQENFNFTKDTLLKRSFTNIIPVATFTYQFARSRSLRFNFRGRTNQPSILQLQDVIDYTSAPNYRTGNPNLKQEFSNNIMLSYNFFDMVKFRNIFALITFNNTLNKIVENVMTKNFPVQYNIPAGGGNQLTSQANMDGVFNVTGAFNIGFPIKMMKGGNFNTNTRITYARNGNIMDGIKNFSNNFTVGEDLRLSYTYKEKLDLGINTTVNYTSARYSIQKSQNQNYLTQLYAADATYTFPKGFILSTDLDYTINPYQGAGIDRDFTMWNASVAKQLFKNNRGEIKLSVYDLLNQNTSFNRFVGDGYIEDVQNIVLNRFFLLSFTYNLNRMGGKSMIPRMFERATRNMRLQ